MSSKLPNVSHVLTVASGKGGVGKTTVTINLALALQKLGARVGVFDADVYGPNVPLMLGIRQNKVGKGYMPVVRPAGAPPYIPPLKRYGLQIMSTGLLVSEDQVLNPPPDAVGQAVVQTMRDVMWESLDYLLVDLPPSAGQPKMGLLQSIAMAGVVIVTTPQDLSLLDAGRSLRLFEQANVPILGIVENMSYFICPNCDEQHEVFQRSSQWRSDVLANSPIIGRIPLDSAISQGINRASPLVHDQPDSAHAQAFLEVGLKIQQKIQEML